MKNNFSLISILFFIIISFLVSCNKTDEPETKQGKIKFTFDHKTNGEPIIYDTLIYVNAAGNPYLVNEIQYFISDFRLWKNGNGLLLDKNEDIHYVDTDLPDTWNYNLTDDIPEGSYDSITFIFGISEEKNKSGIFVNPPESNMFWPEFLGGGYHYLKLNGKWLDPDSVLRPFNFHMGIGQIYNEQGEITAYVQNYFTVSLPNLTIEIKNGETTKVDITMNVENWFKDPNIFDFNYWGGSIMQNQAAMQTAKENGHNVFTAKVE